jgi:hypothetical protein
VFAGERDRLSLFRLRQAVDGTFVGGADRQFKQTARFGDLADQCQVSMSTRPRDEDIATAGA